VRIRNDFVVVIRGAAGVHRHVPVKIEPGPAFVVVVGPKRYALAKDWTFGGIRASGTVNGAPFTAQVERLGVWLRVSHNGARIEAMVLSPRGAELSRLMPFKPPPDMSRFLLSPMPGLLAQIVVQPGQQVQAGERLAVIEAMKMENTLSAAHDGIIDEILAVRGESLAVDQPILSFR
jgi:propionyl-CoA carboxylase alpha chain